MFSADLAALWPRSSASTVRCPVIRVGVKDIFGRSGDPYALLERYGLTAKDVAGAAKRAVSMKK